MSPGPPQLRRWLWLRRVATVLAVSLAALFVFSHARPFACASGRSGLSLDVGILGLVRSTDPLAASPPGWQIGTARVVTAPRSAWYPTTATATISVLSVPPVNMRLYVYYVPLLNLVVVAAAAAGLAHVRLRRIRLPNHCPRCHYDVAGITGRCPECGHDIELAGGSVSTSAPLAH